ncbi:MAG: N-acetylneuraminate synthase family protein [Ferrovibrio sp.]|uniref:N-acetylneuraminate synthase family protein n=1 Tax=Ferrovibrio sp. TaxID=1917215 RepID=UPI002620493C|nr:N-acetylneuraminate synthase family protein [Ferrovibrio sp.]MCW0234932.1 N-acetylneuraminate synthase family protein [Ferrovibrio sp.]
MKIFGKSLDREIAVVAEIGVNHEGDPAAASRLLQLAADTGVDAVKFQSYTPERYASASDPERLARVSRFALDESAHRRLAAEAAELGVAFFSTPLTEDWVDRLSPMVPAYKIASGDLTFEPVIRAAARSGKPVILSTGLGTIEEIDAAIGWVRSEIGTAPLTERLILMHCVSAYPTPMNEANIRAIPFMRDRYGLYVGYSNHVIGPEACWGAIALGATVLEVHMTDQKANRTFRDHELSFEPDELRDLVGQVTRIQASLGSYDKQRMPSETGNLIAVRKGVVAARDLDAGAVLTESDLMYARPAREFPAADLHVLIGRKLHTARRGGELIARQDIE